MCCISHKAFEYLMKDMKDKGKYILKTTRVFNSTDKM